MANEYFDIFCRAAAASPDREFLGLDFVLVPPSPDYGYTSTPRNAITFSVMGVDGVHTAILTRDGEVQEDSPVVYISPMDSDDVYVIAESFLDYLALCCNVAPAELEKVFRAEAAGKAVLVQFLRLTFQRFGRLFRRSQELTSRLGHLIERKPERIAWDHPPNPANSPISPEQKSRDNETAGE